MFRPLELFIGLRYLRARSRNQFLSFITLASMLGVALGVAALIVVLSVMNGFENELRDRLLSLASHATVSARTGALVDWSAVVAAAEAEPQIVGAAPYVELQAMLARGRELTPARLRGVQPALEQSVSTIGKHMLIGDIEALQDDQDALVLGRLLALQLGVGLGDRVLIMVPQPDGAGGIVPRLRRYTVAGVFEIGLQDHDGVLALINLESAMQLARLDGVSGVRLRYADILAAPGGVREFVRGLAGDLRSSDWTIENATYFRAIRLEKTMMSIMLTLIVAVAAFNIVASLVMVVNEKETAIAILRTLGLAPGGIVRVFVTQGTVIGWLGTLGGLALGILLAYNVESIAPWLERSFGFEFMPSDIYYISELPSDPRWGQILAIAVTALVLTALSTIYPARRAARTEPAAVLRYE